MLVQKLMRPRNGLDGVRQPFGIVFGHRVEPRHPGAAGNPSLLCLVADRTHVWSVASLCMAPSVFTAAGAQAVSQSSAA
jgi:hypothetical protein